MFEQTLKSARSLLSVDGAVVLFLAFLFGFAAIDKLLHVPGFVTAINSYSLMPIPIGQYIAPLVIAAELAVVIGLLIPSWRRTAGWQATGLMVIFTIGLIGNRLAGKDAVCGCWFSISMAQGDMHFVLNGIMIAMGSAVAVNAKPNVEVPV